MPRTIAAAALLSLTIFALPAYAEDDAAAPITVTGIGAPVKVGPALSRPARNEEMRPWLKQLH